MVEVVREMMSWWWNRNVAVVQVVMNWWWNQTVAVMMVVVDWWWIGKSGDQELGFVVED
jgi:hypothetical protein